MDATPRGADKQEGDKINRPRIQKLEIQSVNRAKPAGAHPAASFSKVALHAYVMI
jgi:hypothetical protein